MTEEDGRNRVGWRQMNAHTMQSPNGAAGRRRKSLNYLSLINNDCLDFLEVSYPRCSGEESYKVGQSPE